MSEEDIEKMLEDLYKQRLTHKSHIKPKSKSGQWVGVANFDFASLYPSTQRRYFPGKKSTRRKSKIEKIFN